jgi:cytochrome P450
VWLQVLSRSAVATAVVQELLRLEPSVKLIFRKALEDVVLGDVFLPNGTSAVFSMREVRARAMHACRSVCTIAP